jgi:diketogulonate reductase-like aldo/keto reductase
MPHEVPIIPLNDGNAIPQLGLGVWLPTSRRGWCVTPSRRATG